ncbi:MAG: hypothetical protein ACLPXT_03415 [Terracidiphilus sp.]
MTIESLPLFSATRDWIDALSLAVSLVLMIVGIVGIFVALRTLRAVKRQADEMLDQAKQMGKQTKILEDSVAAAKVSAEAASKQIQMIEDKERARIRVEFDDLDLTPNLEKGPYFDAYLVRYKLVLDGLTQAYVVDAHCFAGIWVEGEKPQTQDERLYWTGMMIPEVITPAIGVVKSFTAIQEEGFSATIDAGDERIRLVREGKFHVYCEGSIIYKDVFDGVWETKFQRKWNYFIAASEAADRNRGRWQRCGGTNANGERRLGSGC